ncbi:MAG: hypothetical protein PHI97_22355 [Desulfobulbus sp.]|nr:hypothetical protein [Desulfobulbus sp.]MDD3024503.1 hypothetical protein [Syntrophomonadaceae bacterium]
MILILSNKWDLTVDFVVMELQSKGHEFLRLNTEDLISEKATINLPDFQITISKNGRIYDLLRDVTVIWNRRPGKPFDFVPNDERPSLAVQRFVNDQWYSWLEALQLIPEVTWINHPVNNDAMESKVRQLYLASKIGFSVPQTVVTNDPAIINTNINKYNGRAIAKALYSPLIEEPNQDFFIFANEISSNNIENIDTIEQIKLSPCIIQEPILPKIDYRVTVIGDAVIAAKIITNDESIIECDWRTQKDGLGFYPCKLPASIESLCRSYVKESGLSFGAIDLVEQDGKFIFLEINPNGEWGWLQKPYGFPIAETLVDLMIMHDRTGGCHA